MYCVQCQTAFSWKTGEVVLGRIHNPHYLEFLSRGGAGITRELGDIPCGGLPTLYSYDSITKGKPENKGTHILRLCIEIESVQIPRYRHQLASIESNKEIRIQYLLNDITVNEFDSKIYAREKAREKINEIMMLLNTLLLVAADIFRRIMQEHNDYTNEFVEFREFFEKSSDDISKVYNCVTPHINSYWSQLINYKS
jgi:hypothetical protein